MGDHVYKPFFALAESLGVPIIIHPAIEPSDSASVPRKNIPIDIGYLNDQRTTLIDIVMSRSGSAPKPDDRRHALRRGNPD
ncbi:hypothetical protein DYG62_13910 [Yersinia enterocolitica]|nr:hypothetical protein [Yersinia enterocolitica]